MLIWLNRENKVSALLSNQTLVWIGGLSYSLYLWHWPVLALMRYYTGAEILNWQFSVAFILITLGLSAGSYYWIETPLRLRGNGKQMFGYGCLVLAAFVTAASMKDISNHFTPEPLPIAYRRYADPATICHGKIVGDCLKGDLNSEREVLVLGDSHAAMLNHFFDYLGKELGFKARIITGSSCVTIPGFDYQRIPEYAQQACVEQITEATRHIEQAHTIFLAGKWSRHFDFPTFPAALNSFLDSMHPEKKLFVFGQIPFLKQHPLRSIRFIHLGLPVSADILDKKYLSTNKIMANKIKQRDENLIWLDITELNIFNNPPLYKGEIIYHDQHHLNEIGSKKYATSIIDTIEQKINIKLINEKILLDKAR